MSYTPGPRQCVAEPAPPDWKPPQRLVALIGVMGSGKSTAATYLQNHHAFNVEKFAGPLKDMLRVIGLDDDELEGDWKGEPCGLLCGVTPRHAMQTLGTQWGRELIGPDFWVNAWRHRVKDALMVNRPVVTDDCRFPNEAAIVRELGGVLVRIIPAYPGYSAPADAHESEAHAMEMDVDIEIANDGGISDLHRKLKGELHL